MRMSPRKSQRPWTLTASAIVAGVVLSASAVCARGPMLAELDDFRREGTRRAVFVLPGDAEIEIEAVGAGARSGDPLLAHAWILDLTSREPVWMQSAVPGEMDRHSKNWVTHDEIRLRQGIYAVYFSAHDGALPIDAEIRILGLKLGHLSGDIRRQRDWDDFGDPADWGARVWAKDVGFAPGPVPSEIPEPYPDAQIRLLGLGNGEMREVRFDLTRQVELELHATGEYVRGSSYFADTVWLIDRDGWRRVFTLTPEDTEPAGGAEKNRRFSGRLRLEPGSYLLGVATDQTHANRDWNDAPPWDPDAWGAALGVADPEDRSALTVVQGGARPHPTVAIERVRSDEFRSKRFYLTRQSNLLVRSTGERVDDEDYADSGWIERVGDLDEVWWMDGRLSYPAGGAGKNRIVEEAIELPAGDYLLCYSTDDSHAYGDWNQEGPFDPEFWGITVAEIDPGRDPALHLGGSGESGALVSITPVGNDQHIVKRFEVTETIQVRLVALGEGSKDEMNDFAWLEDGGTGKTIWTMKFDETGRAGGALKNRQIEVNLELAPGVYELHYATDDSHAFGDWNAAPPRRPHLWGVTLLELPGTSP